MGKSNCSQCNLIGKILAGMKNTVWKSPEVEDMAKDRAKVCAVCKKAYSNRLGAWCGVCSCYIPWKIRSPKEVCPEKYW